MVSSWIRSMFSSKKKNKKSVSMLRPRLFKDLELVLLEDRITPAYLSSFNPSTGILSIGVIQNVANDLIASQTVIWTTNNTLNVSLLSNTSYITTATVQPGGFFGAFATLNAPGTGYISNGFTIDLANVAYIGDGLKGISLSPLPTAGANGYTQFILGSDPIGSAKLNLQTDAPLVNNIRFFTDPTTVTNNLEVFINIQGPLATRGDGDVNLDVGSFQGKNSVTKAFMMSQIIVDGSSGLSGSITTNAGGITLKSAPGTFGPTDGTTILNSTTLQTTSGAIQFASPVAIQNTVNLITTGQSSSAPAGANVSFNYVGGSSINSYFFTPVPQTNAGGAASNLIITAGSSGNVSVARGANFDNGKFTVINANAVSITSGVGSGFEFTCGLGININAGSFDSSKATVQTIQSTSDAGDVNITTSGNITLGLFSTSALMGTLGAFSAGDITLSGGDIFITNQLSAIGSSSTGATGGAGGTISITATDFSPTITISQNINAQGGLATTTTGLGGQIIFNSPVIFNTGFNSINSISTVGTATGSAGNITFGPNASINGGGTQTLVLNAGVTNGLAGDVQILSGIGLLSALSSLQIFGDLIELNNIGTAALSGVNAGVQVTSVGNNINFKGNTYKSGGVQSYSSLQGKLFNLDNSGATTFSTNGGSISFAGAFLSLNQADLFITSGGGAVSTSAIVSGNTAFNKDVTINASGGSINTISVGQIGGTLLGFGNADGINTVNLNATSKITLTGDIKTSNFTNNSVTLTGPVVVNSATSGFTIDTSRNTVDSTGVIFLSSTLNSLGQKTVILDATGSQSANVTLVGLIGTGASGSLGGLTIEGNQIAINNIGAATQFGVIGSTLVTAANVGSVAGAISFTGTTYRTNGTQTYDPTSLNALTLNGGSSNSLTSFITSDDAVTFNGSFNINFRNLSIDTTNAVTSGVGIGGANINFNGTVSGYASLTLTAGNTGAVNFVQNIGSGQALTGVVINSSKAINSQAINVSGTSPITLTSDAFNLLGTVSSASGTITLQPNTLSLPLAINNAITGGEIAITTPVINNFSTAGMVIYGNTLGTGNINLAGAAPTSFPYNVTFRTGSAATINVNGSVITPGKTITYAGEVVESSNIVAPTTIAPTVKYAVTVINIINAGSGYISAPIITITAPPAGGTQATATAVLGSAATAGQVVGYIITNPGSGYVTAPTVTFSLPPAGGTLAFATATLGAGVVQNDISITNGGSGFQSPPAVVITGGSGTGATAVATVGTTASAIANLGTQATATATTGDQAVPGTVTLGTQAVATATSGDQATAVAVLGSDATATAVFGVQATGVASLFGSTATATATNGTQATATATSGTQATATASKGTQATATVSKGDQATATANLGQQASGFVELGTLASGVATVGQLATGEANVGTAATAFATVGTQAIASAVLGGSIGGSLGQVFTIPVENSGSGYFTGLQSINIQGSGSSGYSSVPGSNRYSVTPTSGRAGVSALLQVDQLGSNMTAVSGGGTGPIPFAASTTATLVSNPNGILGGITSRIVAGSGYPASASFSVTIGALGVNGVTSTTTGIAYTNQSGQVTKVILTNGGGGTGYVSNNVYDLTVIGGGSGSGAQVEGLIGSGGSVNCSIDASGIVTVTSVNNPGRNYVNGGSYTFNFGGYSGSLIVQATSIDTSNGAQVSILTNFRGNGWVDSESVSIAGGATGIAFVGPEVFINGGNPSVVAIAHAVVSTTGPNANKVFSIFVDNPGSGYITAPTITLGVPGVVSVTPIETGNRYSSAPTVTINGGNGTQASATANLSASGQVISYTVTNQGFNYSGSAPTVEVGLPGIFSISPTGLGSGYSVAPTVAIAGGGGSGATAVGILGTGSNAGKIVGYTVNLANAGSGYTASGVLKAYLPDATFGGTGYVPSTTFPITLAGPGVIRSAAGTATTDVNGTITGITISDLGSGYDTTQSYTVVGGNAYALAAIDFNTGTVSKVSVVNGYVGYTTPPTVIFTGGGGSGATGTATINQGVVTGVIITNPGINYTSAPTVTLSRLGSFAGATALIDVVSGAVTSIAPSGPLSPTGIVNGGLGAGYTVAPEILIYGGGGIGATATSSLSVSSLVLGVTGSGYTSVPLVTLSPPPAGGTLATANALLGLSSIVPTTPDFGGSNYTLPPTVTISAPPIGGIQATADALLGVQTIVPKGGINPIIGGGYTAVPTVSFNGGGGSGATADALLAVDTIIPTSGGSGYKTAPLVTITYSGTGPLPTADAYLGVSSITRTSQGFYSTIPTVSIDPPALAIASGGIQATASVSMSLILGIGSIVMDIPGGGGSLYTQRPLVSFTGGGGNGAQGTANLGTGLQSDRVTSVTITSIGGGYTSSPTVVFTNDPADKTGGGAAAKAYISVNSFAVNIKGAGYATTPLVVVNRNIADTLPNTGVNIATGIIPSLSVSNIVVTEPGTGYNFVPTATINNLGTFGTGAIAQVTMSVTGYKVTDAGTGYTSAPKVVVTRAAIDTTGVGASAIVSSLLVASYTVTDPGAGYTSVPTITISAPGGGGTTANAAAFLGVTNYIITDPGVGYITAPTVTIEPPPLGGTTATAFAFGSVGSGSTSGYTITNGGTGYTSAPTVYISTSGATTAKVALNPITVSVDNPGLSAISIPDGLASGSGYSIAPSVTINNGAGSGVVATATLGSSSVSSINVNSTGAGYTSVPTVTITGGGGTGAAATAIVSNGQVVGYTLTNGGTGYTSTPTATLAGGGFTTLASATSSIASGSVISYTITNAGTDFSTSLLLNTYTKATGTANIIGTMLASITPVLSGSSYFYAPTVTISAPPIIGGTQATAKAVMGTGSSSGKVVGYEIVTPGSGYTSTPTVTVSSPISTLQTGTPARATANLLGSPVSRLIVGLTGAGYTSAPLVTISLPPSGGTQATATAVLGSGATAGQIISYNIIIPGSGYISQPTVTLTGGSPTIPATAFAALAGGVEDIVPDPIPSSTGIGYSSTPTVTLTGGGVGSTPAQPNLIGVTKLARAVAVLGTGTKAGQVVGYSIVEPGAGYSTAPFVTITSPTAYPVNQTNLPITFTGSTGNIALGIANTDSAGVITSVTVTSLGNNAGGTGYINGNSYNISYTNPLTGGVTSTASILALLNNPTVVIGQPGVFKISTPSNQPTGSGFATAPGVTISGGTSGTGFSAATSTAILGTGPDLGKVISYTVNSGVGYSTGLLTQNYSAVTNIATATVGTDANGFVTSITPVNLGSGYTSIPTVTINGTGTGATAIAVLGTGTGAAATTTINGSGAVTAINTTNAGSGYTVAPLVQLSAPPIGGTQATATAIISVSGVVTGFNITNAGSGYIAAPTITFSGSGKIVGYTITNRGIGYTGIPTLTVNAPLVGGTGFTANQLALTVTILGGAGEVATAQATTDGTGSITKVLVLSAGTGYIQGNTYTISSNTGGYGASLTANLSIPNVTITQPGLLSVSANNVGTGYQTAPVVNFSGGGGSGAAATAVLTGNSVTSYILTSAGSGYTSSPLVTLEAPGISSITSAVGVSKITAGALGAGYTSAPAVSFTGGGGTGATATASLSVSSIAVGVAGTAYTLAPTVSISAPPTGGTQATAIAVLGSGASAGQITGYTITNPGTGYISAPIVNVIPATGDSTGTGATANATLLVTNYIITNGGTGYTSNPTVVLTGGGFSTTASAAAAIASGSGYYIPVASITGTLGAGYLVAPTVTITGGGGSGATAIAVLGSAANATAGQVVSYTITNGGTGYTSNPTVILTGGSFTTAATATASIANQIVTISAPNITGGIQATATPIIAGGAIIGYTITNRGSGYTTNPTVTLTSPGLTNINIGIGGSGYSTSPFVTIGAPNIAGGIQATATAQILNGAVVGFTIDNIGSGYTTDPFITLETPGISSITPVTTGSGYYIPVSSVTGTPGAGYLAAPTVSFTGGGGTGATATATLSVSRITGTTGAGYTSAPIVSITGGGGTGATAIASIAGGLVTGYTIINPGTGYTSAPTVTLTGGGSTTAATATATLSITNYIITNGGAGYTSAPTVILTGGGFTTAATATASLLQVATISAPNIGTGIQATAIPIIGTNGAITGYTITNRGSGYTTNPTVTLTSPGVTNINVGIGGSGYSLAPVVTIDGPNIFGGIQATATATISGGVVTGYVITNKGTGYTSAPLVTIADPGSLNILTPGGLPSGVGYTSSPAVTLTGAFTGGTGATAIAILGIGADAGKVIGYTVNLNGSTYTVAPTVSVALPPLFAVFPNAVGSGYLVAPTVTFSGGGGGTGASATAVLGTGLTAGQVVSYNVISTGVGFTSAPTVNVGPAPTGLYGISSVLAGSGYTVAPPVIITGGGGTGAVYNSILGTGATAGQVVGFTQVSAGSGYTTIPTVTLGAPGIVGFTISNSGTAYSLAPLVTISGGGGTGATAVATLGSGATAGQVTITLVNAGSGYTSPPSVQVGLPGVVSVTVTNGGTNYTTPITVTFVPVNTSDTTNGGVNPSGANIIFSSLVNGLSVDGQGIILNAGTAGTITMNNSIGGRTRLSLLKIQNSNGVVFQNLVNVANDVEIVNTMIGRDIRFNGLLTTGGMNVSSNSAATSKGYNLYINGGANFANPVTFNNTGILQLGNASTDSIIFAGGLVATSPSMINLGAAITTIGGASFTFGDSDTSVNLIASSSVDSGTGTINFGGAVSDGSSAYQLSLQSGNGIGNVNFTGNITIDSIVAKANAFNINFTGSNNVLTGSSSLNNTGGVIFGDSILDVSIFTNGLNVTASPVTLSGTVGTVTGAMNLGLVTLALDATVKSGTGTLTIASVSGGNKKLALQDNTSNSRGLVVITGNVNIGQIETFAQNYAVSLLGNCTVTSAIPSTFLNTGATTFGDGGDIFDTLSFTGGLIAKAGVVNLNSKLITTNNLLDIGAVTILGTSTLQSGTANIIVGSITDGANSYNLSLQNTGTQSSVIFTGDVNISRINTVTGNYAVCFQNNTTVDTATIFNNLAGVSFGKNAISLTTFTNGVTATLGSGTIGLAGSLKTTGRAITLGNPTMPINLIDNASIDSGDSASASIILDAVNTNGKSFALNSGTTAGAAITVASVDSTAGGLTIVNAGGLVSFTGNVGRVTNSGAVNITNSQQGVQFLGQLYASNVNIADTALSKTIKFGGNLNLTGSIVTSLYNYNVDILGTTNSIGAATSFNNLGNVNLNSASGSTTFTNGFGAAFPAAVNLNGTIISNGQVNISKPVNILAATTATLNSSTNTISGAVTGSGSLTMNGAGSLLLTGNSTGYIGTINANAGNVAVNANFANANATVGAAGKISGTGSISTLTANGGFVSPGNSPGTLTVGTATLGTAGAQTTYNVEINGTSAGQFDQIKVNSSATLANAVLSITAAGNLMIGQQFQIVSGTTNGQFANALSSIVAGNTTFSVTYNSSGVLLTVASVSPVTNPLPNPTPTPSPTPPAPTPTSTPTSTPAPSPTPTPTPTPAPIPTGPYALFAVGADAGGGPEVKVNFTDGSSVSFYAYDMAYRGGVRVTMGDLNGDGTNEIITGTGPGGGPNVRVFNVTSSGSVTMVANFFAFEPQFMGGVYVAAGNLNGDVSSSGRGIADLIVSAGPGGGPRVIAYAGGANYVNLNNQLCDYFVYSPAFTGGVSVAAGNVYGAANSPDEIITGAGPGGGPHVRAFQLSNTNTPNSVIEYMAFDPAIRNGIYVGAGDLDNDGYDEIFTGTNSAPNLPSMVNVRYGTGNQSVVYPFGEFTGGARVGVAKDSNNNQYMVVGAGPGGGPLVQIYNRNLIAIDSLFAFPLNFTGGVFPNTSIS